MARLPMRTVALAMARAGLSVFPLWPGQKRPATTDGLKSATRNPRRIGSWWTTIPTANIGIATGASGLVVVDCDTGKPWPGDGEPPVGVKGGDDVLLALAEELGVEGSDWLFSAPTTLTPSGGVHLYYRAPQGVRIRSRANVAPWVDVRARGGYVVAAFSRTEAGHYRPVGGWDDVVEVDVDAGFRPVGIPQMSRLSFAPPVLPDFLVELLADRPTGSSDPSESGPLDQIRARLARPVVEAGSGYAMTALRNEVANVCAAVNGTRNQTLNYAAYSLGQLVAVGLLVESEVVSELSTAARSVGLDDIEIGPTIRSGLSAGRANPRQVTTV